MQIVLLLFCFFLCKCNKAASEPPSGELKQMPSGDLKQMPFQPPSGDLKQMPFQPPSGDLKVMPHQADPASEELKKMPHRGPMPDSWRNIGAFETLDIKRPEITLFDPTKNEIVVADAALSTYTTAIYEACMKNQQGMNGFTSNMPVCAFQAKSLAQKYGMMCESEEGPKPMQQCQLQDEFCTLDCIADCGKYLESTCGEDPACLSVAENLKNAAQSRGVVGFLCEPTKSPSNCRKLGYDALKKTSKDMIPDIRQLDILLKCIETEVCSEECKCIQSAETAKTCRSCVGEKGLLKISEGSLSLSDCFEKNKPVKQNLFKRFGI